MSRIDVMVDIETLGTDTDATIIQLAAIAFDINTGQRYGVFNEIANIAVNERPLRVSGSTIKWWLNTNKELLAELLVRDNDRSSEQLLRDFYEWLIQLKEYPDNNDVYLWGNGILFDNKMIEHQFKALGLDYPIFYRNDRDVRTIVELAATKLGLSERELKERYKVEGMVAHNALNDVIYQIDIVVGCFNELVKNEKVLD